MDLIGTHTSPLVFMIIVAIVFLVLGCFVEGPPIVLVFIPLLMPVAIKLGIDPIHFGVMFGLVNLIGSLTPPMAVTMYMTCSITGATVEEYPGKCCRSLSRCLWSWVCSSFSRRYRFYFLTG